MFWVLPCLWRSAAVSIWCACECDGGAAVLVRCVPEGAPCPCVGLADPLGAGSHRGRSEDSGEVETIAGARPPRGGATERLDGQGLHTAYDLVLGVRWRENLGLPDGWLGDDPAHLREIVVLIRRPRPRTIAVPYWDDRHPDHAAAGRLLTKAVFRSRLARHAAAGDPWRADWMVYYFIDDSTDPASVVDVSAHCDVKVRDLDCCRGQFQPAGPQAVPTRLTSPQFRQLIVRRGPHLRAVTAVEFAEGMVARTILTRPPLGRDAWTR
jgi:hypothetical protein